MQAYAILFAFFFVFVRFSPIATITRLTCSLVGIEWRNGVREFDSYVEHSAVINHPPALSLPFGDGCV